MDEPIPEDELADWSHDIDLFMEGLNNPDKLEALWEQSKAKKLWDESLKSLDQHLSQTHPVAVKDYMSRWCNTIQTPNSPTRQEDLRMPRLFSPKERDNLEKYDGSQSESKADGSQQAPSHTMKTFFDSLSNSL